ncbi:uncharacterized protein LOC107420788 [Ziziphus jujuba]|uniref:Uncharacterized protein LOC107420788 n=1 Tax=Ziziphus jujuba TaxID=326968 RepID=A0A6P4AHQ7_ZIZJJ|nr:uncharacterized protein LOC107420788 [Ziziphus jujuba]
MGSREKLSLLRHLMKTAVKKMKFIVLSLKWRQYWRRLIANTKSGSAGTSYRLRRWSFNDRLLGLYGSLEHGKCSGTEKFTVKSFQRTTSYGCEYDVEDVDQRAEIFIANFRSQLRLERQVSLRLRYLEENSSNIGNEGNSLFSEL